jgi:hypothetical protein
MRPRYCLVIIGWLLAATLVFGQTSQPPANAQSTGAQPGNAAPADSHQQAVSPQPASQRPVKPSAVAAAASASRLASQSAPPVKVIRNHDISDGSNPPDADKAEAKQEAAAEQPAQNKVTQAKDDQDVRQFEAQGKIFQNQIKVEKGKIIDIQNHITLVKNQFAAWSVGFAQDDEAQACWTSTYYTPYYKDWCDRGRNLKAEYEASQVQLAQEKVKLEQMQEDIRRKGYGNGVYDPD